MIGSGENHQPIGHDIGLLVELSLEVCRVRHQLLSRLVNVVPRHLVEWASFGASGSGRAHAPDDRRAAYGGGAVEYGGECGRLARYLHLDGAHGTMGERGTTLMTPKRCRSEEVGASEGCTLVGGDETRFPLGMHNAWRSPKRGMQRMRQRWYLPELGEFASPDPMGHADSFNPYAFAAHDPINRWVLYPIGDR